MKSPTSDFAQARANLQAAREGLREAKDDHDHAKAMGEVKALAGYAPDGRDAKERAVNQVRHLVIKLAGDHEYQVAYNALKDAEFEVMRLESRLEALCDDRRLWEWSIRLRQADVLEMARRHSDSDVTKATDDALVDGAFRSAIPNEPTPKPDWIKDKDAGMLF